MEYRIIQARKEGYIPAIQELEEEVQKAISEGWKPLGGVSAVIKEFRHYPDSYYVAQAMVKE